MDSHGRWFFNKLIKNSCELVFIGQEMDQQSIGGQENELHLHLKFRYFASQKLIRVFFKSHI